MNILTISKIKKTYIGNKGKVIKALQGVDLEIKKGEVFGLLGPNGAGKTTLSSIIATLTPATEGEILYEGKSIYKDLFNYRKQIGFCPQKPNLYPTLTIEENLVESAILYGLSKQEAQKRSLDLMKRYNLLTYKDQYVSSLSGGYQQRASICRALIHEPKIILLDEPTVGLDPNIRRELWQEIKQLKQLGVTIILTTHYLDEAEYLSDRVCVLRNGIVKFLDTPENFKINMNKSTLEDVMIELFEEETS